MLDTLITSKTRIKLLLRFFLNSNASSYLRSLASEFDESTNSIRVELNRFEKAGLLDTYLEGNKKMFKANTSHPLFPDIKSLLMKHIGLDKIVENVIKKLGEVKKVLVAGDFANGMDSKIIDLIFVGEKINKTYLITLVEKAEKMIKRRIRYLIMSEDEYNDFEKLNNEEGMLVIWGK